nr:uncharacterized protein LOC117837574 isoform X2 [Setaria viridis]
MARTDRSLFAEAKGMELISKKRRKRTRVRCSEAIRAQASAGVACLRLRSSIISSSSDMGSTRGWSSRLLAVSAFVCLLAALRPPAMVNGLRREELVVLGRDPAPAPAPAEAPAAGGANAAGVDAAGPKQFVAPAATTIGAVEMSKWRVRRGSDPIHNRS